MQNVKCSFVYIFKLNITFAYFAHRMQNMRCS